MVSAGAFACDVSALCALAGCGDGKSHDVFCAAGIQRCRSTSCASGLIRPWLAEPYSVQWRTRHDLGAQRKPGEGLGEANEGLELADGDAVDGAAAGDGVPAAQRLERLDELAPRLQAAMRFGHALLLKLRRQAMMAWCSMQMCRHAAQRIA